MNDVNKLAYLINDAKVVKITGFAISTYTNKNKRWYENDIRDDTYYSSLEHEVIEYESDKNYATDNDRKLAKEIINTLKSVGSLHATFKIKKGDIASISFP